MVGKGAKLYKGDNEYDIDSFEGALDILMSVAQKGMSIQRYKGLGEMNPDQLKDTTMHPDTRRLLQVQIPEGADDETRDIFVKLMGKGEAAARRAWMEKEGDTAELDI